MVRTARVDGFFAFFAFFALSLRYMNRLHGMDLGCMYQLTDLRDRPLPRSILACKVRQTDIRTCVQCLCVLISVS